VGKASLQIIIAKLTCKDPEKIRFFSFAEVLQDTGNLQLTKQMLKAWAV